MGATLTSPHDRQPTRLELVAVALVSLLALIALGVMGEHQAATTATSVDPMTTPEGSTTP